jgi:hypothetical protein
MITDKKFDEWLQEKVVENAEVLLKVPGVYEAVSEYFNNEILGDQDVSATRPEDFNFAPLTRSERIRRYVEKLYLLSEVELGKLIAEDPVLFLACKHSFDQEVGEEYEDDNSHFRSYDDVLTDFEENIKPAVIARYGADDEVALREGWNDWTDGLCKDGEISPWAYENWVGPE